MTIRTENLQNSTVLACPNWASTTTTPKTTSIPKFAYPGAKVRLRKTIVSFMPTTCATYAEPFAGRGNVFWLAASTLPCSNWWINDTRTAPFFQSLISIGSTLDVPAHTREEFERLKTASKHDDPAAILLAPYLTYNGAGYAAGYRQAEGSPTQSRYESTLRRAHQILIQTKPQITALDWKVVASDLGEGDFAYFDPPYIRAQVHSYRPSDINHLELVDELKSAKYRWILSEYPNDLYLEAFGPPFWTKDVQLCSTNFRDDAGKERRVECLWRNY
jgi:site-specific DNA-adenine methylase